MINSLCLAHYAENILNVICNKLNLAPVMEEISTNEMQFEGVNNGAYLKIDRHPDFKRRRRQLNEQCIGLLSVKMEEVRSSLLEFVNDQAN